MLLQKHRLQRGWSQAQLATASGLSTRTVQRIEAGQQPSIETLKCLAAALDVDFSDLKIISPDSVSDGSLSRSEEDEAAAFVHVKKLQVFYSQILKYIIVISTLWIVNLVTNPRYFWVLWVMLGWGLGLVYQGMQLFKSVSIFGPEWERRQVEKRLGRPL